MALTRSTKAHSAAEVARASGGALTEADFASYRVTEAKPAHLRVSGQCRSLGAAAFIGWCDLVRNS